MNRIQFLVLINLFILISPNHARPNNYSTNSNHLSQPNDLGKSSSIQPTQVDYSANSRTNSSHANRNGNQTGNQTTDQTGDQIEHQTGTSRTAASDNYQSSYPLEQDNRSKLNNSQLNNETKPRCSGPATECLAGQAVAGASKANEAINSISDFKQEDKQTPGIRYDQPNAATRQLDEHSYAPHSRPEGEQPDDVLDLNNNDLKSLKDDARTNATENATGSAANKSTEEPPKVKNQSSASSDFLIVPFTPVTIAWTRASPDRPASKCTPKAIPNSTYKLKYNGYSVQYRCNDDYTPRGQARLYCFQGVWVPSKLPVCERK